MKISDKAFNLIVNEETGGLSYYLKTEQSTDWPGGASGARSKKSGKYRSSIRLKGKRLFLGYFNSAQEAHEAYIRAAIKFHGEFATFRVQP